MGEAATNEVVEEVVDGTNLAKVKESVLDRTLESIGIEPIGTVREKVVLFQNWTLKHSKRANCADCDTCGGTSDVEKFKAACPYCGSVDEAAAPPLALAGGSVTTKAAPPKPARSRPSVVVEEDDEDDGPLSDDAEEGKGETMSAVEPATGVHKKNGVSKKNGVHMGALVPASVAKEMTAKTKSTPPPKYSAEDLDAAVKEFRELEGQAGSAAWHCWKKLLDVSKSQLWKARLNDKGKPAYKKFEQFIKAELNITKRYAYMMMGVAANFSEKQMKEFGATKLRLVLEAPKEMRGELLDKVKKGASKSDIEKEIPRKRKDPEKTKAPKGAITVATIVGKKTLKMFAKPTNKNADPKPAKRLADLPVGTLDLTNDVRMHFAIVTNAAGEIVLHVTTKRTDE